MVPRYESFGARPEEFFGTGDHVFVLGHYEAVSKSGEAFDARFVHVWTVADGKLTHLRQTADSHVLQNALNG